MPSSRRPTQAAQAKVDKYQRRYAEIIDAAASVFADKGYHGSSTKDIADLLGIRQGSLYYYFPSKESALEDVCQKGVEGFVAGLEAVMEKGGSFAEQLRGAVYNHLEPLRDRPNYVRVFLRDRYDLSEESRKNIAAASRHYETLLEGLMQAGVEAGEFRSDLDCRLATLAMLGMCNEVVLWFGRDKLLTLETIAESYADLLLQGVKPA